MLVGHNLRTELAHVLVRRPRNTPLPADFSRVDRTTCGSNMVLDSMLMDLKNVLAHGIANCCGWQTIAGLFYQALSTHPLSLLLTVVAKRSASGPLDNNSQKLSESFRANNT